MHLLIHSSGFVVGLLVEKKVKRGKKKRKEGDIFIKLVVLVFFQITKDSG